MPVWVVTGKLGGGKTLWAVSQAFQYLSQGRRVATNIDLFPDAHLSPLRDNADCRLLRLPDRCTARDLDRIWIGNPTNDESKNGLVMIDEAATFLNARNFQDGDRSSIIDWILHSRKYGWDLIIVIQAISALDKQIREMVAEYKVTVRRMDRMAVPFFSWFGVRVTLPRIHFATVRYGLEPNAPLDHRDFFRGADLFKAYRTKQSIRPTSSGEDFPVIWPDVVQEAGFGAVELGSAVDDPAPGLYSVLSPWHLKGRYMKKSELLITAGRRAFVAGLMAGAAFLYSGQVAFQKYESKRPHVAAESVNWLSGASVFFGDDGFVTILDEKGVRYVSRTAKTDASGTRVFVDGKWIGVRRNG